MVCGKDNKENIYHFMLHCIAYNEEKSQSIHLQQPYIESKENILGCFLFNKENIWKRRQCHTKTIQSDSYFNGRFCI